MDDLGFGRITRVHTNGMLDDSFLCTNRFGGLPLVFLQMADHSFLFGGNISQVDGVSRSTLFRLNGDGQLDTTFDVGLTSSSIYGLIRKALGAHPRGRFPQTSRCIELGVTAPIGTNSSMGSGFQNRPLWRFAHSRPAVYFGFVTAAGWYAVGRRVFFPGGRLLATPHRASDT